MDRGEGAKSLSQSDIEYSESIKKQYKEDVQHLLFQIKQLWTENAKLKKKNNALNDLQKKNQN